MTTTMTLCWCHLHGVHGSLDPNPTLLQPHLCNPELRDQAAIKPTLTGTCQVIQVKFNNQLCTHFYQKVIHYAATVLRRFLLKIGVNAE